MQDWNPELFSEAVAKGADFLDREGMDFGKWSLAMVNVFGERIRPDLEQVWTLAHAERERRQAGAASVDRGGLSLASGCPATAMKLPPPPPIERRFWQFLTAEGQRAVEEGRGPVYELLVKSLFDLNRGCFTDESEVKLLLTKMVWPPNNMEDLFSDWPHIPKIITDLRVEIDGDWIPVFEAEPKRYLRVLALRASLTQAFRKQFGDVSKFREQKAGCVAEGMSEAEFSGILKKKIVRFDRLAFRPWWKFW